MTRIKLKNSTVLDKAPTAADLEIGELAINANVGSPGAYIKDTDDNIIKIAGSGVGETPTLQEVTDEGSTTTQDITANKFIGDGSELTNLPEGTAQDLQSVLNQGSVSSYGITLEAGGGGTTQLTNAGTIWGTDVYQGSAKWTILSSGATTLSGLLDANGGVEIPQNGKISWATDTLRMYTFNGSNVPAPNRNAFATYAEVQSGRDYYVTLSNTAGVGDTNEVNFGVWTWDATDPSKIYANMGGAGTLLNINKNTQKTYIKKYDLESLPSLP